MIDFGICQSEMSWGDTFMVEADIVKIVSGMAAVGASRVRFSAAWDFISPQFQPYNNLASTGLWANLDRAVSIAVAHGLKPLLVIHDGYGMGGDGSTAAYGAVCKAVAQRYGPAGMPGADAVRNTVSELELFNEENSTINFNPGGSGSPALFDQYLAAGYTAIKSVASSMTVISGGLIPAPDTVVPFLGAATNPPEWETGVYAGGGKPYFDAVGMHWYGTGIHTAPSPDEFHWQFLTSVRALMVANGDSAKKIWVTEIGIEVPGDAPDLATGRDWLKLMLDFILSQNYFGPFFTYNFRPSTQNLTIGDNQLGLVDWNYNPNSPYYNYVATLRGADTADTTPPSAPTGVTVTDVTDRAATLTWNPSTDNVAVTDYWAYLSGVKSAVSATTSARLTGLTPGTPYSPTVTALDAAGNESSPSAAIPPFTTNAPSGGGLQAFFQYNFIGTGSTLPTTFVQLGLGFSVSSDVALPNAPSSLGAYLTVAPYTRDQQSPDHSSSIMQATTSAYPDRAALALARMAPDGTQFAGATITGGGQADACKIFTFSGGILTVQDAINAPPLLPGEQLICTPNGNIYTATRITANGVSTDLLSWTDVDNAYPGAANQRTGYGWLHKHDGVHYYAPPGITGQWKASDLKGVHPVAGSADSWMLALVDESDWPELITTGLWQSLV